MQAWRLIINNVVTPEKLKELEKENEATYGVGLAKIWELRKDHPFMPCAKCHDLAYLVAYLLEDMNKYGLAYEVIKIADKEFKECVFKVAKENDSLWLKIQARLFTRLIVTYRHIRF